ncbi:MAG TPA: hypothetical protein VM658_02095 [bacterium]|nr:hypothetical protein [bacterium]
MPQAVEEALRTLHEFVGRPEFALELGEAKKNFYAMVGAPLPGEPLEEQRLSSFIEWFIFDRQLAATRRTPVEDYLRLHADDLGGPLLAALVGFTRTVHSVFQVKKRSGAQVDLADLYTGLKHRGVSLVPVTLDVGDLAELRIAPVDGAWYATDSLCFHPFTARKQIMRMIKEARKQGKPVDQVVISLMLMNTRYERYPKTAKRTAYAVDGPLARLPGA